METKAIDTEVEQLLERAAETVNKLQRFLGDQDISLAEAVLASNLLWRHLATHYPKVAVSANAMGRLEAPLDMDVPPRYVSQYDA